MALDIDEVIAKQRERLTKERNDIQTKMAELQGQLAEIERKFAAIVAYESTLAGKLPAKRRLSRSSIGRSAKPAVRGEKQTQVLHVLEQKPGGMTRGEVIGALGVKGSKSGEQSVSNALTALKKVGKVVSTDGKWRVAAVQGGAKKAGRRLRAKRRKA